MKSPDTTPNTIEILAPTLADAAALAKRLSALPEVNRAITLASFIPEQQEAETRAARRRRDAARSRAQSAGGEAAARRRGDRSRDAAHGAGARAGGGSAARRRCGDDAARLAKALTTLAKADPAARERAREALIPGLLVTLEQLRAALQAEPVTLENLPADLVRDWIAPDGRARIEVFPKGDANDNAALQRFTAAVRQVAPERDGHHGGHTGIEPHHRARVPGGGPVGAAVDHDTAGVRAAPRGRRPADAGAA